MTTWQFENQFVNKLSLLRIILQRKGKTGVLCLLSLLLLLLFMFSDEGFHIMGLRENSFLIGRQVLNQFIAHVFQVQVTMATLKSTAVKADGVLKNETQQKKKKR